jgi:Uma2 family endonuclease
MVQALSKQVSLAEFLSQSETKPASEYIDGRIVQKPMPKTRHSRLQGKFINVLNRVAEPKRIAYAFPELRCTFGNRSIVPDITVLRWENIKVFQPNRQPEHCHGANSLIIPNGFDLTLTSDQVFNWLKMNEP